MYPNPQNLFIGLEIKSETKASHEIVSEDWCIDGARWETANIQDSFNDVAVELSCVE